MRRRHLLTSGVAFASCAMPLLARAQSFPSRPIRIILPYAAGGNTDVTMREIARALSVNLKQQVIIDNKPGANSIIGTDFVAKSPPDGYTLLTALGAFTINPYVYRQLPYTPDQLAPVSLIGKVHLILAVGSNIPVKTFTELVQWAKQPGQRVSFDSSGVGSALHLVGERISRVTGMKALHVAYKGIAQSLPDVLSGQISFTINSQVSLGPFIQDGRLRPLAILSSQRSPDLPGVPTIAELGYPALESYGWQGVLAPAATPKPIIDELSASMARVMADPNLRKRLLSMGLIPIGSSPSEFAAFIKEDSAKIAAVVKEAGIVAE